MAKLTTAIIKKSPDIFWSTLGSLALQHRKKKKAEERFQF